MTRQTPDDQFMRRAEVIRVIDGDTLRLNVDLGWGAKLVHDVRLLGLDTPEPRGPERPAGEWVTSRVQLWLREFTDNGELLIHSQVFSTGSFGRCLCDVWSGDYCLNEWLLKEDLAWRTCAAGKVPDRNIDLLTGIPPEIRDQVRELQR